MKIKCWGSRGSIAVAGNEYCKFGGETTCIQVIAGSGENLIIDAGTGIRKLGIDLVAAPRQELYLFLTHAHWDHISGFTFFKPLQDPGVTLTVQNSSFSNTTVEEIFKSLIQPPFFPITMKDLEANIRYKDHMKDQFTIGSLSISTIALNHPGGGLGYKFTENGKSFVFLTDNELGYRHPKGLENEAYERFCSNADLLFHDAEFTPDEYPSKTGWGHSAYTDVIELAIKARVKELGLFHLNQERTDIQMDKIVDHCRRIIKDRGESMACLGVACNMEFNL
ncbi:Phosphoribosyl 1,2-cyclic phosphodiesterase [Desulfocicer vacuolatum DSM 3385]|uniref:Phosphoribosyl 1,2-cyclic phosphodiesterase n=1 Tax=Desulfocicer vacuolatum DSM 3385 TaxID=1121400 RepID=A0A1W2CRG9_9BACT|nr:MBL fold metallo-hydrolase [Desulfocicer vacuolatum]SMC87566.1 Phosphoribosyl 1,2-cyclic phosphodiesterase [Desulfocicer vacuolatum DSM 3385]